MAFKLSDSTSGAAPTDNTTQGPTKKCVSCGRTISVYVSICPQCLTYNG